MSIDKIACPSVETLNRLLQERLGDADRDSVETHVEVCRDCQTKIESMLSSTFRPMDAAQRAAPEIDRDSDFFRKLRERPPPESTEQSRQSRRLGQYEIFELLGKGGMGDVYRARHVELGKLVALKVLKPDCIDEVAVARFKQEIRAVGRLDHPNIVVAHDAGKSDGRHFLVMEYVDGLDLARLVKRLGALSIADACEAVRQAAVGLQHAFERGLVHRDVKPSNLMVGRDGRVRLLDLGLARSFGEAPADTLTAQGALLGTADYLAPEQWDQPHAADIRADIYSLGCTLFHLIVGRAPFSGPDQRTVFAKARAHAEQPAPLMSDANPDVPADLETIVDRMLAKRPGDRFATPAEVAAAVAPYTSGANLASLVAAASGGAFPGATSSLTPARPGRSAARRRAKWWMRSGLAAVIAGCAVGLAFVLDGRWGQQTPNHPRTLSPSSLNDSHVNHDQGKDAKPVDDLVALNAKATEFCKADQFDDAIKALERRFELIRNAKGANHFDTTDALRTLRSIEKVAAKSKPERDRYISLYQLYDEILALEKQGKYVDAISKARENLQTREQLLGRKDDSVAVSMVKLGQLLTYAGKPAEAEREFRGAIDILAQILDKDHPALATARSNLASSLGAQDKLAEAESILEEVLNSARRHYGIDHPETAVVANNVAGHYDSLGLFKASERHYRSALDILLRSDGEDSRRAIIARSNLAFNLDQQTRYAEAEPLYRQVLAARRKVLGEDHPDTAMSYGNLATNLDELGRHAEAELLARKAVDILKARFGDENTQTAMAINNLAMNLQHQGKFADAELLFKKSLDIHGRQATNGVSRHAARVLNNLGTNLQYQGRVDEARQRLENAIAMYSKVLPPDHPDLLYCRTNLAGLLDSQGRHAEAGKTLSEVYREFEKKYGKHNALTAQSLGNWGVNVHNQGKYADAEPLLAEALALNRKLLGESHPTTTWSYLKLIANWWAQGKHSRIAELGPAAAASFEAARIGLSGTGLERIARTNQMTPILQYLTVISAAANQPIAAWKYLEGRLGRGLLDDLPAKTPGDKSPDRKENAVRSIAELPQIQSQLDPDMAIVGWVDVAGDPTFKDPDGLHFAVVVRKTGDPIWIKIGDDAKLSLKVRDLLGKRPATPADSWESDLKTFYSRRLAPLEKHLAAADGRPAVRRLIVLPSNVMAGIPIEALTDKYTVSYAPSATTFWYLRSKVGRSPSSSKTLLALGNPNYQRASAGTGDVADRTTAYAPLPATQHEVQAVARLFSDYSLKMGSEASEQTLARMASLGELKRFRYLHLAAHALLDDRNMLKSALILAQDQLPTSLAQVLQENGSHDGRLTAADILRDWKLDADLVTLSASETALGKFSGGEGYVGFIQALFVAGARSVLLSNWKVDDRATALLMRRFYENLLGDPSPPLSKAEALAEAKTWLRNLSSDDVQKLVADLPKGLPEGTRGPRREVPNAQKTQAPRPFQHPYYWSSFVLIGDAS